MKEQSDKIKIFSDFIKVLTGVFVIGLLVMALFVDRIIVSAEADLREALEAVSQERK